ncbi:MAG TPA: hypothetical protein VIQ02_20880, partial [Jiangellaceae bacterium]
MSSKPAARRRRAAIDADGVAVDALSVAVGEERIRQPLLTRLMPPVVRSEFVVRQRLHRRIREGVDRGLTLAAAAPGFGKSTLLAAGRADESAIRPVAWLTLVESEDDPVALCGHLVDAIHAVRPQFGLDLREMLAPPAPPV